MLRVRFDINDDEFAHLEIVNKGEIANGKFKYDYVFSLLLRTGGRTYTGTVQYEREEGAFLLTMICLKDWKIQYRKQSIYDTLERGSMIEREVKYPVEEK